jgi:hypothetical protein
MVTEASPPTFANTSVTHFWDSVRAVTARFPLYSSDDDDDEEPFRAGDDVAAIVSAIDPPAMDTDQFWSTFVDDVQMGDFPD